jgi:protein TonB
MFGESMINSKENRQRGRFTLIFSGALLIHFIAFTLMAVIPSMKAGEFPKIIILGDFALKSPPAPPPPPPRGSQKVNNKTKKEEKPKKIKKPKPIANVIPIDVPETIEDEDISDLEEQENEGPGIQDGFDIPVDDFGTSFFNNILNNKETKTKPIRIIKAPRVIRRVKPVYPEVARTARIQGVVILSCETNARGRVISVKVLKGHPLLVSSATQAVRKWLFEPMIIDGIPRPVKFSLIVHFSLQ